MKKIKKLLSIRIISFIAIGSFLFTPALAHSLTINLSGNLRIPLISNDNISKERQEELQKLAFLKTHGLSRFLSEEESFAYLDTVTEIISLHTGQPHPKDQVKKWIENKEGWVLIAEKKDKTKVLVSAPLVTKTKLASNEKLILNQSAEESEIIDKLSSDDIGTIDEALPILRLLQNREQVIRIVEKVCANKGLRLEIFEKNLDTEMPNIRIIRISDNTIVGHIPFLPSHYKILAFHVLSISEENLQGKRLFPLLSYWMVAHPYFSRCAGWDIMARSANSKAAKAFWRSGFDNIKIVNVSTGKEIKDIKEIGEKGMYDLTAKFPGAQESINQLLSRPVSRTEI